MKCSDLEQRPVKTDNFVDPPCDRVMQYQEFAVYPFPGNRCHSRSIAKKETAIVPA